VKIDNDETKDLARSFVILAHVRTGGTFCAHALSNHPQVYCDRGETLHHGSAWRKARIPVEAILGAIWGADGYHAAGFRAIYTQAYHDAVWPLIETERAWIIHLTRENVTRQAVSNAYQQMVRHGTLPYYAVHSFEERRPEPVEADVTMIVGYARRIRREVREGAARLACYEEPVLEVTYEEMTGGAGATEMVEAVAYRIEDFLEVERARLPVALKRDFPVPMREWFTNWRAMRRGLKAAGFGGRDG